MGPNCGLYVPSKEEVDEMGLERHDLHPNFARHGLRGVVDLAKTTPDNLLGLDLVESLIGEKLALPKGTPRMPGGFLAGSRPYPGATRNWSSLSLTQVRRIRNKAPGIVCSTYFNHGRTGEAWGIDAMVSPFNRLANAAQERLGDHLSDWAIRNWNWLNLNYVIWWNWMNDGAGWFSYEPFRRQWSGGSQNRVTSKHKDHWHGQVDNPWVPGNE